jgi:putative spermidine/putrescine transport system permease protein
MMRLGKKLGAWGAVLPLLGYCAIALGLPIWALLWEGLHATDPVTQRTSVTLSNLTTSWHGIYLTGLLTSLRLSLLSAVISAVLGIFAAYAIAQSRGRLLKQAILTASGVLANFGGIPLAFCFIATIGTGGVFTSWIQNLWPSFQLGTFSGVAVVYPYFMVPLMVLTTLPALDGLRDQWKEASANLGGSSWQYWRHVGGPLLLPSALGGFVLCFGSAFAAYATANALTSGSVPLVTTQIASILSGNVIAGENNLGMALAFNTIVVCGLMMAVYLPLRKRSAKWLES